MLKVRQLATLSNFAERKRRNNGLKVKMHWETENRMEKIEALFLLFHSQVLCNMICILRKEYVLYFTRYLINYL